MAIVVAVEMLMVSTTSLPPLVEPYSKLWGANATGGQLQPLSPDPLVRYTWNAGVNLTGLQRMETLIPIGWVATPASAFEGLESLNTSNPRVIFKGPGSLRLDFGREHAAWFEFESPDLGSQVSAVTASISEYSEPWDGKTRTPVAYSDGVYRLETNQDLYEGVRFAWITYNPAVMPSPTCVSHGEEDSVVSISCPDSSGLIKAVTFGEFGTATGDCGSGFKPGDCGVNITANVTTQCIGKNACTVRCIQGRCTIEGVTWTFGDPCPGKSKKVTLSVKCTGSVKPHRHMPPWQLSRVRIVSQVKPVNYSGAFSSSDSVLTQSWYTGAYGSRLNMMPYGFNSILMDRGDRVSIQGDGHPTMAAALVAFGSQDTYDLVHKMLIATDSGCSNHSNCRVVDSQLRPYPLYWASSVNDWYWASGDTARFLKLAPDMARIIDDAVNNFLRPDLNVEWFGWDDRVGNGFCGSCNLEAQLGYAALTIRACVDFSATLKHAGDEVNASRYISTSKKLAKILRARPTSSGSEPWWKDYGVHAVAYLINARVVATPSEELQMFAAQLTNPVTICSWSPFNQYWILQALGNIGKMEYAVASIKLCWGPMLNLGKGCFWELFSPEWSRFMEDGDKAPTRPSYCHPWADGVTHWLTHTQAGIVPLKPGYQQFAVLPYLSFRVPHVSATQPTPHGDLKVFARRHDQNDTISIEVESMVSGLVGLRVEDEITSCKLGLDTVKLNGKRVIAAKIDTDRIANMHPTLASLHIFVDVSAGKHTVTASYSVSCMANTSGLRRINTAKIERDTTAINNADEKGYLNEPPFPPPQYPAHWEYGVTSGGAWINRYGKQGYQLFAFDNGTDVTKLPSWVESVSLFKGGSVNFVGLDASNASYLDDPRGGPAALGFATHGADGSQGTVLDVNVTEGTKFNLTLYMVSSVRPKSAMSWSFTRQAIRVLDLVSLNPIAPDPLIENSPDGVYWTLTYDRGVRLRVMPIDSDAGFSAVFFDAV